MRDWEEDEGRKLECAVQRGLATSEAEEERKRMDQANEAGNLECSAAS